MLSVATRPWLVVGKEKESGKPRLMLLNGIKRIRGGPKADTPLKCAIAYDVNTPEADGALCLPRDQMVQKTRINEESKALCIV